MSIDDYMPEDLLIKILLCLTVTTLLRFKSVCKSWLSLINSSHFIHRHATTSSSSSKQQLGSFIFLSKHVFLKKSEIALNTFSISVDDHEFEVYEDLGMPPCYRKRMFFLHMVGSCNGVICLHDSELKEVSLWNPTIRQFRRLPKSFTFAGIGLLRQFVGFGFDVETKDYKVVLVQYFSVFTSTHRVQMYNLSTNCWRTLEDVALPFVPMACKFCNGGGYLNGSYYCSGSKVTNTIIENKVLSFDFTKQIFKTIQLPDGIKIIKGIDRIIFLGEKIVLVNEVGTFINPDDFTRVYTYDLWVLNIEVGVKESWTKLYTIGPYNETERPRPIGISNNGEFTFMVTSNGESLWLLNRSTQGKEGASKRKQPNQDSLCVQAQPSSCLWYKEWLKSSLMHDNQTMLCSIDMNNQP